MPIRCFLFFVIFISTAHGQTVRFEPTPIPVMHAMVDLAAVSGSDLVYDLGCGDGRLVIEAAYRFGARGVCVDIDPRRIAEARGHAAKAGVTDLIRFRTEDLLDTDFRDATVVMLFLSPDLNDALAPKLRKLKPGTRVVSHWPSISDWKPDKV